ncbi:hypothetical protein HYV79_02525 [Candidatus Woesearchaeota archaeon]|nr:hypothetical protein [Candidatus Woesearchaeota archaeon]
MPVEVLTQSDVYVLRVTLAVIIGTLAAIVYCLRVLVLMERRLERIEAHADKIAHKILKGEKRIESSIKKTKK